MASSSYIKRLLPVSMAALGQVFDYLLAQLRAGRPTPGASLQDRGGNLQWYPLSVTTPSVANEEFSVRHGLDVAPYVGFPALDLTVAGGQFVPLTVTRPADGQRVYLSSTSTSAPVTFFVEG